jgi:hypothetical protein
MIFRRGAMAVTDSTLSKVALDDMLRDAMADNGAFREMILSALAASQINPSVMPKASSAEITGLALNILTS